MCKSGDRRRLVTLAAPPRHSGRSGYQTTGRVKHCVLRSHVNLGGGRVNNKWQMLGQRLKRWTQRWNAYPKIMARLNFSRRRESVSLSSQGKCHNNIADACFLLEF